MPIVSARITQLTNERGHDSRFRDNTCCCIVKGAGGLSSAPLTIQHYRFGSIIEPVKKLVQSFIRKHRPKKESMVPWTFRSMRSSRQFRSEEHTSELQSQ